MNKIHTYLAPAKINTYLHIVGKRADGYHLLDTQFQLIDLCDTVRLRVRADGQCVLHTSIAGLPDDTHLAMRAARLLQAYTQTAVGADIWVDKRIPQGAGLGGGSSDAATTLMALNQLWACGLAPQQLQTLGLQLGADVPFFCTGWGAARGAGIGEVLTPVQAVKEYYIVIYPDCVVPTPAVFKHPDLTWGDKRAIISGLVDRYSNDLQNVAQIIAPPVNLALSCLRQCLENPVQAHCVRMSGSGSAVFASFSTFDSAQSAWNRLKLNLQKNTGLHSEKWQMWLVEGLQNHPNSLYES